MNSEFLALELSEKLEILFSGFFFYVMQAYEFQTTIFNTGNYLKKIKDLTEY